MKAVLVQLEERILKMLERVAPGRGRRRSQFIRDAVLTALMQVAEVETERAYRRWPQEEDEWPFDPADWAPEEEAIHPAEPLPWMTPLKANPRVPKANPRVPKANPRVPKANPKRARAGVLAKRPRRKPSRTRRPR